MYLLRKCNIVRHLGEIDIDPIKGHRLMRVEIILYYIIMSYNHAFKGRPVVNIK